MSDTDKIVGTAIAGVIGIKLLETGFKMIDKQKKRVKKDKWL